jgi:threonine aldolase
VTTFSFHRKGTGHLLSKHRYVSAQFAGALEANAWLKHAAHANAMARMLADGLTNLGLPPRFPVQANAVFVTLPPQVDAALQCAGHGYYPFGDPSWNVVRLMCSFNTREDDVRRFLADVEAAVHQR